MAVAGGTVLGGPLHATARTFGRPPDEYGERSAFEHHVVRRIQRYQIEATSSLTPLAALHGMITPSALHFERHHAGIPHLDPHRRHLLIHGLVERPLRLDLAALRRYPAVSRFHFVECAGNSAVEWHRAGMPDVQGTHGLTSCSQWTGVPLSTLLREAGVRPGGAWVLAEGADACLMTRSVPLAKCLDDVLVAYAQNGEALRPEQGYPLRLLVPGWEGNINIKWLRRLEVGDRPFMTREETAKYTDLRGNGRAEQFTFVMGPKSVITTPSGGVHLQRPGFHEIRGLAWSGHGRIAAVEVSTDGGRRWQQAHLDGPTLPKCHTPFTFAWRWQGKPALLQSRCRDELGTQQPTIAALRVARDLHPRLTDYHQNGIQTWAVDADGRVTNGNHRDAALG